MSQLGIRNVDAPGASSRFRFRRQILEWWREHLAARIAVTLVPIALTAVALLVDVGPLLLYALAFLSGVYAMLALVAWMIPPRRVENYRTGAAGEVNTAKQIDKLVAAGWRPVHDRALERTNVDHIVIGPGGVFAIDSKNWTGTIKISNGKVVQDGTVREKISRQCRSTARQINATINSSAGKNPWVQGVVVFWGDFPQGVVEADRVAYVAGDRLVEWFRERPARLSGVEIDEISRVIAQMRPGIELSLAS